MSNFDHPKDLNQSLEFFSEKFDEFHQKFNPQFSALSLQLRVQTDQLKERIEKYVHYSEEEQLKHLVSSEQALSEIQKVSEEVAILKSKYQELEKMFRFGQNLL